MKKFGKFLFGTLSVAAAVGGLYCLYKNSINKNADEDFDDFDDAMEDEDESTVSVDPDNREYVSINITTEDSAADENAADSETVEAADADSDNEVEAE